MSQVQVNVQLDLDDEAAVPRTPAQVADIVRTKLAGAPWHTDELTLVFVSER